MKANRDSNGLLTAKTGSQRWKEGREELQEANGEKPFHNQLQHHILTQNMKAFISL